VRHEIRTDAIDSTAPFCARLTKERATHFSPSFDGQLARAHTYSRVEGTGVSAVVEVVLRRRVLGWDTSGMGRWEGVETCHHRFGHASRPLIEHRKRGCPSDGKGHVT
jgi:hypothetical protein